MAFKVQAQLGLDGSQFFGVLGRAQGAVGAFAGNVGSRLAAAFSIGAIGLFTKSVVDMASSLRDASDNIGVNVEWLQRMANGARMAGSNMEALQKFIAEMEKSRMEAMEDPKGRASRAFSSMGVGPDKLSSLSTQKLFDEIVKSFSNGMTSAGQNALFEVGGRSARQLVGAFAAQFESDLPVIEEQVVDTLETLGDRVEAFSIRMKVAAAPLISDALGLIDKAITGLRVGYAWLSTLVKETFGPGGFSGAGPRAMAAADQAASEAAFKDALERNAIVVAKELNNEARRNRENAAPSFGDLLAPPKDKLSKARAVSSDSLVSVGNFLGSSMRSRLESLTQQQIQIGREQLQVMRDISNSLKTNNQTPISGFPN